jgi:two-component system chemotaxis response regulator CheB
VAYEIAVVGTSWGGLTALHALIAGLPEGFALPLVIVQHRHKQSDSVLATLLQDRSPQSLAVFEVEDKMPIAPGSAYVAPADYHLLVEQGYFSLSTEAPVRFSRPSIDVTFVSAADSYGERAVGIVLTGANTDGSRGLERIFDRGGLAFVQDPRTAESATMPEAAIRCVPEARVLTIAQIAEALGALPTSHRAPVEGPHSRHAKVAKTADGQ